MAIPVTGEAQKPITIANTLFQLFADGFLINQPVADSASAPITLSLNWKPKDSK